MRGPDICQFVDSPGDITLFEYAHGTKSIFGLLEKNAEQKTSFDDYMRSRRLVDAPQWFDIYPAATKFANVRKNPDATLLVDIGGGPGQELERFKSRYPDIPGRCVLQGKSFRCVLCFYPIHWKCSISGVTFCYIYHCVKELDPVLPVDAIGLFMRLTRT